MARNDITGKLSSACRDGYLTLTFSSPRIRGFHFSWDAPRGEKSDLPEYRAAEDIRQQDAPAPKYKEEQHELHAAAPAETPHPEHEAPEALDEPALKDDNQPLSKKERKKQIKKELSDLKKQEKDREYEKKRYVQIRREAHRRGYDTTVLTQFEDPEEFLNLSNEEVERVEAVGVINNDGFYDFVYPPDADSIGTKSLSAARIRTIVLVILAGMLLLAWNFRSMFSSFSFF